MSPPNANAIRLRTKTTMALAQMNPLQRISSMLLPFTHSILRSLPTVLKVFFALVFLLNIKSWPFVWHIRIFKPVWILQLKYKLMRLSIYFKSKAEKAKADEDWFDSITPIGESPFGTVITYHSRATLDESDFNGHLSNSSYPKTLDCARMKTALEMFPRLFTPGGWIPLAETHFHFVREIPILSPYEVRISMGSWDQKWVYVVGKFVTLPKNKSKKASSKDKRAERNLFHASLRTPADDIASAGTTPFPSVTPMQGTTEPTDATTKARLRAVAADLAGKDEPDGAILHTVSVSLCCFKVGRITVPPSLVLAMNGYCDPAPAGAQPYSRTNPPPHWQKAKKVMSKPDGGSMKKMAELMKGGWRDVPEEERWWEEAFRGVEELRRVRLAELELIRKGMESARRG
ncbi:hypothetical protein BDQ17DRAFT_1353889 [Cyathus striatus]|nr:hypothetical protein BDQ17DRAFT_1353889 [Cyathus striatus]